MAENKKSFVLYADILPSIELLKDHEAGKLFKHILKYVNDEYPKDKQDPDNKMLNLAWQPIKKNLKADLKKWEQHKILRSEAGKKSGEIRRKKADEKRTKRTSVHSVEQTRTKRTVNVNVNVNDIYKENINKRKAEFNKLLAEHKEKYPEKMLKDFEGYWTEHGPNDKKMRYEKQTSFSIARRLTTWKGRSNGTYDNNDESYTPV